MLFETEIDTSAVKVVFCKSHCGKKITDLDFFFTIKILFFSQKSLETKKSE